MDGRVSEVKEYNLHRLLQVTKPINIPKVILLHTHHVPDHILLLMTLFLFYQ